MASIKKIEGKTGTSYKITVTKGRDSSGKQIRHFKTWTPERPMTARQMEKEVQREALEFEREIDLGFQADDRQTFEEYAQYFIQLREQRGMAQRTIALYYDTLKLVSPDIGHMRLKDIRPQHLNALYKKLEQPGASNAWSYARPQIDFKAFLRKKGITQGKLAKDLHISHNLVERICRGERIRVKNADRISRYFDRRLADLFTIEKSEKVLAANTIRRYHEFISVVLAQAEKEMIIPYNPASRATPPIRKRLHEPDYFQPEELYRIFEALESESIKYKTLVYLLAVTGCRRGEIIGLRWEKIDFENMQIKIDSALNYLPDGGTFDGPTKTKNTRYITLPKETVSLLQKYRAWQAEQRLKAGDQWNDSGYVFAQDDGTPMIPASFNGWLYRFSRRHNLPHIHPHAFRHTAASILISEGVDIVTVSKMLGHANTSMTTDVYSHIIEESKRKATECIADVMLRKKKA